MKITTEAEKPFRSIYTPSDIPGIAVGRLNRTDQYVIGQEEDVRQYGEAFQMLLEMGLTQVANISVVIAPSYLVVLSPDQEMLDVSEETHDLYARFGIYDQLKGVQLDTKPAGVNINLNIVGIRPQVRNPVFVGTSYTGYIEPGYEHLLYASDLLHEERHIHQHQNSLPSYSLWAEQQAMLAQVRFFDQLLTMNVSPLIAWYLLWHREQDLRRTHDYKNGRNFNDHLDARFLEGTPQHDEEL